MKYCFSEHSLNFSNKNFFFSSSKLTFISNEENFKNFICFWKKNSSSLLVWQFFSPSVRNLTFKKSFSIIKLTMLAIDKFNSTFSLFTIKKLKKNNNFFKTKK